MIEWLAEGVFHVELVGWDDAVAAAGGIVGDTVAGFGSDVDMAALVWTGAGDVLVDGAVAGEIDAGEAETAVPDPGTAVPAAGSRLAGAAGINEPSPRPSREGALGLVAFGDPTCSGFDSAPPDAPESGLKRIAL